MMDLTQTVKALKATNKKKMARDIGVTQVYLQAISDGVRVNPSYVMLKKISDYLEDNKQCTQ